MSSRSRLGSLKGCSGVDHVAELRGILRRHNDLYYRASQPEIADFEYDALKAELAELRADKRRLDWLADKDNKIGNVSLPTAIVERTLMLRDSIDLAMQMTN